MLSGNVECLLVHAYERTCVLDVAVMTAIPTAKSASKSFSLPCVRGLAWSASSRILTWNSPAGRSTRTKPRLLQSSQCLKRERAIQRWVQNSFKEMPPLWWRGLDASMVGFGCPSTIVKFQPQTSQNLEVKQRIWIFEITKSRITNIPIPNPNAWALASGAD